MLRVDTAEVAEDLSRTNLEVARQRNSFQPSFLQFDKRFACGINREQDVRIAPEVIVHCTLQIQLRTLHRETALVRIMPAELRATFDVIRCRASRRERRHHADVHVTACLFRGRRYVRNNSHCRNC